MNKKKNGVACENWPFSELKELDLKSSSPVHEGSCRTQ